MREFWRRTNFNFCTLISNFTSAATIGRAVAATLIMIAVPIHFTVKNGFFVPSSYKTKGGLPLQFELFISELQFLIPIAKQSWKIQKAAATSGKTNKHPKPTRTINQIANVVNMTGKMSPTNPNIPPFCSSSNKSQTVPAMPRQIT